MAKIRKKRLTKRHINSRQNYRYLLNCKRNFIRISAFDYEISNLCVKIFFQNTPEILKIYVDDLFKINAKQMNMLPKTGE